MNGLATSPAYTIKAPGGLTVFGGEPSWGFPHVGGTLTSDVNGDGWLDLIVPAIVGTGGSTYTFCVYPGSPTGFPVAPASQIAIPGQLSDFAGGADVNGDGYGDVLVLNQRAPNARTSIFQGSAAGLPSTAAQNLLASSIPAFVASGAQGLLEVSLLGDTNGDGLSDFVVGWGAGAAVYQGAATISQTPVFTVTSGSFFW